MLRWSQVLASAEEREKKVLAAEQGVAQRRRELEREHAARVGEAEAAVRRVQVRHAGGRADGRVGGRTDQLANDILWLEPESAEPSRSGTAGLHSML